MGLHRAGYEVTGVDINPQPHYPFPARFIQADALALDPAWIAQFALVWASWPCQLFSVTHSRYRDREYPDLIAPGRRLLEASGRPWIMENVVGAPLRNAVMLCGEMFGLGVLRHRLFESNYLLLVPPHPDHRGPCAPWGHPIGDHHYMTVTGSFTGMDAARRAMGIDWKTTRHELAQAIPPAYATFLARQLIGAPREGAACA